MKKLDPPPSTSTLHSPPSTLPTLHSPHPPPSTLNPPPSTLHSLHALHPLHPPSTLHPLTPSTSSLAFSCILSFAPPSTLHPPPTMVLGRMAFSGSRISFDEDMCLRFLITKNQSSANQQKVPARRIFLGHGFPQFGTPGICILTLCKLENRDFKSLCARWHGSKFNGVSLRKSRRTQRRQRQRMSSARKHLFSQPCSVCFVSLAAVLRWAAVKHPLTSFFPQWRWLNCRTRMNHPSPLAWVTNKTFETGDNSVTRKKASSAATGLMGLFFQR